MVRQRARALHARRGTLAVTLGLPPARHAGLATTLEAARQHAHRAVLACTRPAMHPALAPLAELARIPPAMGTGRVFSAAEARTIHIPSNRHAPAALEAITALLLGPRRPRHAFHA